MGESRHVAHGPRRRLRRSPRRRSALRDQEQAQLTDHAYAESMRLLGMHRAALDRIAAALLERETLSRDELVELFKGVEPDSRSSDSVGVVRVLGE